MVLTDGVSRWSRRKAIRDGFIRNNRDAFDKTIHDVFKIPCILAFSVTKPKKDKCSSVVRPLCNASQNRELLVVWSECSEIYNLTKLRTYIAKCLLIC